MMWDTNKIYKTKSKMLTGVAVGSEFDVNAD